MKKITSWKTAIMQGLRLGSMSFLLLTVFTCFLHYVILRGESYIGKVESVDVIHGISFVATNVLCGILATIVPVLFLRYTKIRFLALSLLISTCIYSLLYIFCVFYGEIISFGLLYPMEEFDAIIYSLVSFPIGSCVGTISAVVINTITQKR